MLKVEEWINDNPMDNDTQIKQAKKNLFSNLVPYLATMSEADCVNAVGLLRQASRKEVDGEEVFHIDGIKLLKTISDKRQPVTQNVSQEIKHEDEAIPWPSPLGEVAYHGLLGGFVKAVTPFTEADPAALLMNLLVGFGSQFGRNINWEVSGGRHYPNLYGVIVGDTNGGAKGTSWEYPKALLKSVDPKWECCGGLSSSEGVLEHIKDPIVKEDKDGKETVEDAGVFDKRWLVFEPEFAGILKQQQRNGNTLSEYIRKFWDCEYQVKALTRNSPLSVTKGYVSILGHITKGELLKTMDDTSVLNGLGNRFIWICSRQSKFLSRPKKLADSEMKFYTTQIKKVVEFAKAQREIDFTEEAFAHYDSIYKDLRCQRPGTFGSIIARRCQMVIRLSMIYAIMDMSKAIELVHLKAALEFWRYSEESVKYIFGQGSEADPIADKTLELLKEKPEGMTQTEIFKAFKSNKTSTEIKTALEKLSANGQIMHVDKKTTGRPSRLWMITKPQNPLNGGC